MARLFEDYKTRIRAELRDEFDVKNSMALPALRKVVVSMGTGSPVTDRNRCAAAIADLTKLTGQKPATRRARKSVSNFKVRDGYDVGCQVTLRGRRMYEFVDRLFSVAVPRLRDFRGLNPRSFDGRGNYSMGVPDQSVFAEIDMARVTYTQGMNITFVTSAKTDELGRALLSKLGLPFRGTEEQK